LLTIGDASDTIIQDCPAWIFFTGAAVVPTAHRNARFDQKSADIICDPTITNARNLDIDQLLQLDGIERHAQR